MADTKTYLRELGVATGVYLILQNRTKELDKLSAKQFFVACSLAIENTKIPDIFAKKSSFTDGETRILKNSFEMSKALVLSFKFNKKDKIIWCGGNIRSTTPVDLIIGKYHFSLKEESFILENMGLYKYLNLMTGKEFDRGTHIFEMFAQAEYNQFFNFVWNIFLKTKGVFSYQGGNYTSKAIFNKTNISLSYKKGKAEVVSILPKKNNLSIREFTRLTNSLTREKVFSKWIKATLERNKEYKLIKKSVSELAASNLVSFVNDNLDPNYIGLKRFLRVHDDSYYYAKSTNNGVKIYKVPGKKDFEKSFSIKDISYKVPESQVNINTTIINKISGEILVLRNELRFSHGQFNGTPEAKMYYSKEGNLETIYEKVF